MIERLLRRLFWLRVKWAYSRWTDDDWADYKAETAAWDATLNDGLDDDPWES